MSPTKESTIVEAKNSRPSNKDNPALGDAIAAELDRTDLGHLINEYKNVVIAILILFILGAFGFSGWKSWKANKHESSRQAILEFKNLELGPAKEKKKNTAELFSAYQSLLNKVTTPAVLMELTPDLMTIARDSTFENQDWIAVFKNAHDKCAKNEFCFLHFGLAAATLMEDNQKFADSLSMYQSLIGNPFAIEDKLYFDLVRVAKSANQNAQKNTYLDFLKKNHSTSNYKTLAEQL